MRLIKQWRSDTRTDCLNAIEVLLLTKDDCKFCEEAKTILRRLGDEFQLRISIDDIASPRGQALALDGGLLFPPGIVIDGRPFSYGRPSEKKLRRELERIARSST